VAAPDLSLKSHLGSGASYQHSRTKRDLRPHFVAPCHITCTCVQPQYPCPITRTRQLSGSEKQARIMHQGCCSLAALARLASRDIHTNSSLFIRRNHSVPITKGMFPYWELLQTPHHFTSGTTDYVTSHHIINFAKNPYHTLPQQLHYLPL
jgi:hypothetical protein